MNCIRVLTLSLSQFPSYYLLIIFTLCSNNNDLSILDCADNLGAWIQLDLDKLPSSFARILYCLSLELTKQELSTLYAPNCAYVKERINEIVTHAKACKPYLST